MRRDEVIKAINFAGPAYVPICFFNADFERSDVVVKEVQHHFQGSNRDVSEWGFTWERMDDTMGQPNTYVVESWNDLPALRIPEPAAEWRFDGVARVDRTLCRSLSCRQPRAERVHLHVVSARIRTVDGRHRAGAGTGAAVGGRRVRLRGGADPRVAAAGLRRGGLLRRLGHPGGHAGLAANVARPFQALLRAPVRVWSTGWACTSIFTAAASFCPSSRT